VDEVRLVAGHDLRAAGALAALIPSERSPSLVTVALLLGAYAFAFRLDFEISSGSAVPTQLILVPMLFLLPTGSVPLAVAGGILLGSALEYARGTLHAERVFIRLLGGWHAVGPALVLGLAGESPPNLDQAPLYLLAWRRSLRSTSERLRFASGRRSASRPSFTCEPWPRST
jgi:hypothetical protein